MLKLPKTITAALALLAPLAFAQSANVVHATDATQVAKVLTAAGYTFSLDRDEEGFPLFHLEIADGYKALLFFYDDDPGQPGYESLQLYAAFSTDEKVPLRRVNDWNYNYRFGKVYLDDELDPVIESDLDLAGGVQLEGTLQTFLANFEMVFQTFVDEVVGQ
ncbi:MAG TPA: YbjN domain-containing protein [Oceanithermus profundus]|uniref:YbjN domain-containing protein n=1 Tax=Oceanithermus profundus TaxID=187137 RepID=A0A7C4Z6I3_9DEIN|nr:YbjN domain-containing protein [Oceanithermus profundus]